MVAHAKPMRAKQLFHERPAPVFAPVVHGHQAADRNEPASLEKDRSEGDNANDSCLGSKVDQTGRRGPSSLR
jgi:hypothetical protein